MDTNNTHFDGLRCTENNQQFERIDDDEEPNQQLKITDLIQEFLEQIFMYLDLASLVRAADVCTQFRKATKLPFKRIYARNLVELAIKPELNELYHVKNGHLTITNLKVGANTLRCFGDSITQLKITNPHLIMSKDIGYKRYWVKKNREVLYYANEYCHESLTSFSMDPPLRMHEIQRPFSNVRHVCLSNSSNFSHIFKRHCLNTNFPQLHCLNIETVQGYEFATEFLPNLQELTIESGFFSTGAEPLQLNQQIRKFAITFESAYFENFYDCVPHLQLIQELDLTYKISRYEFGPPDSPSFDSELAKHQIHLQNVRIFKLNLDTAYRGKLLPRIPLEFNQLKSFSLEGDFLFSENFYDFIKRYPTITSLSLRNKYVSDFVNKFRLMSALPSLEELAILSSDEITFTSQSVINYLANFNSVNRFMFYCREPKADVIKCCGTKWNAQIIPHNYSLTLITLTRIY